MVMKNAKIPNKNVGCYHVILFVTTLIHLFPLCHLRLYLLVRHKGSIANSIRTFHIILQQAWFHFMSIRQSQLYIKFQYILHVVGFYAKCINQ